MSTVDEKLDEVLKTLTTVSNQMVKVHQDLHVLNQSAEANSIEDAKFRKDVRQRLVNLEAAIFELAKDVHQNRDRIEEVDDEQDRRLKLIEGNGHV